MNINVKRGLALLLALVLCIGLLPATQIVADAATVDYVYSGDYIYNWGTRGETATFLSPNAEEFYTNTTYETLSAYPGGTGVSDAPSSALYTALQTLMKDAHSYETSYEATKNLYQYTDCQNSGKDTKEMSSFYSGDPIGPTWDSGKTWNREHTWPNSKGLAGNDENDIMMLRPTASSENGARGNKAYGTSDGFYYPNKESNDVYDVRGDVARIFLYIYVRWGNVNGNSQYGTVWGSDGVIESLEVLLDWMEADPVDTWELGRNDSVEAITGTRNVFVDYPEFAFLLFGEEIPTDMTTPSGEAKNSDPCQHNYVAGTPVAPTCTEEGYTTYTCTLCSKSYNGDKVAATGHNYVEGTCQGCGKTQPSGDTVLLYYPQDQKYVTGTEYLYTSTTSGNQKYELELTTDKTNALQLTRIDSDDGTVTFATADGKYLMADGTNVRLVDAEDDYTRFILEGAANGYYIKCATATYGGNAQYLEVYNGYLTVYSFAASNTALYTFQLENLDGEVELCQHSYSSVVTAPTCTEEGYTTYTCTLCGYSYTGDPVDATGHSYENGACTVCGEQEVTVSSNTWTKVELSAITASDTIAITMTKDGTTWALYNANGTSSAPTAIVVTVNGSIMTCDDAQTISWNISNTDGKLIIYVAGTTEKWLYSTSTNNGTRVGTNANKTWVLDAASGYLKHEGTGRYLGVYIDKPDWRSYTNTTGNTAGQTLSFWKLNTGSGETPVCTHTNTQTLPAVPATCTETGLTEGSKCADCGEVLTAQTEVPATGHNYANGTCANCGAAEPTVPANGWVKVDLADISASDTIAITMTKDGTTWALYNANGTGSAPTAVVVTIEGDTMICDDPETLSWNISNNNGKLTIYVAGSTEKWLYSNNKNNGTRVGTSSNSIWVLDTTSGYLKHEATGRYLGVYIDNPDWRAYTSTTTNIVDQTLNFWKLSTGETPAPECQHTNTQVLPAVPATCTEPGLTEGKKCTDCGEVLTAQVEVPATGHDYDTVVTAPNCTEGGYTTYTCSVCGHSYTGDETPATGHDHDAVVTAPNCTEGGYTTYTCSVCGHSYTGDETPATGHDYDTVVTAPNCTEGGYTTYTCSVCGHSYTGDETPATGHDHDAVVTPPNCTEIGYTTYTCSTCGDSKVEDMVPALGHNHQPQVVPPTCTEPGYTLHKCSRCEDSYTTNPVEARGHTEVSDPAVAPTCVDTGLTAGIHCDVCGEVLVAQTEVPATGEHTYEDGNCTVCGQAAPDCDHGNTEVLPSVTPSCTASGWTEGSKCAICGEILIPQEEIPATGHNYVDGCTVDIIPTEKTEGHLTGTCVVCSAPVEVTLPALNMAAYAFAVVTAPADGNPGTGRFTWNETAYGEFSFEVEFRYGDVNGDGMIDGRDVVQLRKFMANYDYDTHTSTEFAFAGADVNGDGQVNGQDVILLRRYMANYDYDTGESPVILGPSIETP